MASPDDYRRAAGYRRSTANGTAVSRAEPRAADSRSPARSIRPRSQIAQGEELHWRAGRGRQVHFQRWQADETPGNRRADEATLYGSKS